MRSFCHFFFSLSISCLSPLCCAFASIRGTFSLIPPLVFHLPVFVHVSVPVSADPSTLECHIAILSPPLYCFHCDYSSEVSAKFLVVHSEKPEQEASICVDKYEKIDQVDVN